MKAKETDCLQLSISEIYGDKPPKKVKKLLKTFDKNINVFRETLLLHKTITENGSFIIVDDRGYKLDGVISYHVKDSSPEDIDTLVIEIALGSQSIEGLMK